MNARDTLDSLFESFDDDYGSDSSIEDYYEVYEEAQNAFLNGEKHQPWKLIPAALLKSVWMQYGKYGRVDENGLAKVWDMLKRNVIRVEINSGIKDGYDAASFFQVNDGEGSYDDIPEETWDRWFLFVSDGDKNSRGIRNMGEVNGNARYSDCSRALGKLLHAGYMAKDGEARIFAIDKLLNFVHGMGPMAKWFVEGGTATLDAIADYAPKGATMGGWQ